MAGMSYGTKYSLTKEYFNRKDKKEPGVYFSKESNKFIVLAKNETKSKLMRPLISVAQFKTEQEAIEFFKHITESKLTK